MASREIDRLRAPRYSDDERATAVDLLMDLNASQVRDFLREHGLSHIGTKHELQEGIEASLSRPSVSGA